MSPGRQTAARIPAWTRGGRSSVGRAPGCGPGGRGFEPHRSPLKRSHASVILDPGAAKLAGLGSKFTRSSGQMRFLPSTAAVVEHGASWRGPSSASQLMRWVILGAMLAARESRLRPGPVCGQAKDFGRGVLRLLDYELFVDDSGRGEGEVGVQSVGRIEVMPDLGHARAHVSGPIPTPMRSADMRFVAGPRLPIQTPSGLRAIDLVPPGPMRTASLPNSTFSMTQLSTVPPGASTVPPRVLGRRGELRAAGRCSAGRGPLHLLESRPSRAILGDIADDKGRALHWRILRRGSVRQAGRSSLTKQT